MATELLARARQFLGRSDFESLLSGFRSGSFLDHFEWSGKHGRKCCLESDPRIRFEADHVAGSRRSKRATLGPERARCLLRNVCGFNTTLKAGAQDSHPAVISTKILCLLHNGNRISQYLRSSARRAAGNSHGSRTRARPSTSGPVIRPRMVHGATSTRGLLWIRLYFQLSSRVMK